MIPQLLTGARGKLKIGTTEIAFVTDVSLNVSHNVRPVHTFGVPNARSVEPLSYGPVSVSIGRVIPVNAAAKGSDGKPVAVNTSAIQLAIEPVIAQMLVSDDISIELTDKITGATIANIRNCRFQGRSMSVSASALSNERWTFMGIYDAGPIAASGAAENTPGKLGF